MGRSDQIGATQDLRQKALDGGLELLHGDRALELRLDPAVATDEEGPGLRRQPPFAHPAILAVAWIVALVDLDVDEAKPGSSEAPAHAVDDVDDRPARATAAVARRRERDDERHARG